MIKLIAGKNEINLPPSATIKFTARSANIDFNPDHISEGDRALIFNARGLSMQTHHLDNKKYHSVSHHIASDIDTDHWIVKMKF